MKIKGKTGNFHRVLPLLRYYHCSHDCIDMREIKKYASRVGEVLIIILVFTGWAYL
ncbi:hypothetical protein N665_0378s0009 [Sinapis alba]|nr:hypothetical protein N665_0378s0009 [Sinapis alba]